MITPITPAQADEWAADFARRALAIIAESEALAQFGETHLTEDNRQGGLLLQGYQEETKEPVSWTTAQLNGAAATFQRIGDVARFLGVRGENGRSVLADLRGMARPRS